MTDLEKRYFVSQQNNHDYDYIPDKTAEKYKGIGIILGIVYSILFALTPVIIYGIGFLIIFLKSL